MLTSRGKTCVFIITGKKYKKGLSLILPHSKSGIGNMKNCFRLLLVVGVISVFCKTLLAEPLAMPNEESNDYEEGEELHASLTPVEEEGEEDRFFGIKCIKYAGICAPLCVSKVLL